MSNYDAENSVQSQSFINFSTIKYTEQGKGQGVSKTVNMIGAEIDITFGFLQLTTKLKKSVEVDDLI